MSMFDSTRPSSFCSARSIHWIGPTRIVRNFPPPTVAHSVPMPATEARTFLRRKRFASKYSHDLELSPMLMCSMSGFVRCPAMRLGLQQQPPVMHSMSVGSPQPGQRLSFELARTRTSRRRGRQLERQFSRFGAKMEFCPERKTRPLLRLPG